MNERMSVLRRVLPRDAYSAPLPTEASCTLACDGKCVEHQGNEDSVKECDVGSDSPHGRGARGGVRGNLERACKQGSQRSFAALKVTGP
jgi:hypothetical protein